MGAPGDPSGAVFCAATGKVRHPSRKVALANLRRVTRGLDGAGRDRKERGVLVVYRCGRCSGWHIGNHDTGGPLRSRERRRKQWDQEDAA